MRPYLCLVRCPHVQRFDGVADGNVSVHTHDGQREGAGEHVVVVDGHHCLAQDVPKWPKPQEYICALGQGAKTETELWTTDLTWGPQSGPTWNGSVAKKSESARAKLKM